MIKFLKKIFLFWIISLWIINFSNAWTYTYTWTSSYDIPVSTSTSRGGFNVYIPIPLINTITSSVSSQLSSITCVINSAQNTWNVVIETSQFTLYQNTSKYSSTYKNFNISFWNAVVWTGFTSNSFGLGYLQATIYYARPIETASQLIINYSCTFDWDNIIDQSSIWGWSSCSPTWSCTVNNKLNDNILYSWSVGLSSSSYTNIFNYWNNGDWTYCIKLTSSSPQQLTFWFANWGTSTPTNLYSLYADQYWNWVCLYWNKSYFNAKLNSSSNTVSYEVYKLTDLLSDNIPCEENSSSCDYSDYELKSNITENYCTNKFSNLINEEDITSWYCETEFWLIDPENCPASGWTWDINWSNFFVNSEQIQGASMVYLRLPEFLNWDYTYINSWSTLNINVENAWDSEYIQNILDIQSYHPDKDQFAFSFAWFLTLLMPYIIITLFVLFIWRLIRRIFK